MSASGTPDFLPHTHVPTVNQLGYCLGKLNYLSEAFLNFSKQHPGRTLNLECVSYSPLGGPDTVRAGKYECTLAIAEKATS